MTEQEFNRKLQMSLKQIREEQIKNGQITKEQLIEKVDNLESEILKMKNITWNLRMKILELDPNYEFEEEEKEDFGHYCDYDSERDALWDWIHNTAQELLDLKHELINKDVIENK